LCYYLSVAEFPTFGVFENGKYLARFTDDYDEETLVDFIESKKYLMKYYRRNIRKFAPGESSE
jgi:hypothetical protein